MENGGVPAHYFLGTFTTKDDADADYVRALNEHRW